MTREAPDRTAAGASPVVGDGGENRRRGGRIAVKLAATAAVLAAVRAAGERRDLVESQLDGDQPDELVRRGHGHDRLQLRQLGVSRSPTPSPAP